MLVSLLKYESMKRWKVLRYVLLAFVLVETVLLIASKVLLIRNNIPNLFPQNTENINVGVPLGLTIVVYFVIMIPFVLIPAFEGAARYEQDISGKQAPLELMIPAASWKKITSKIITIICVSIVCTIIAAVFIIFFFLIMSNFDKNLIESIHNGLKELMSSPVKDIFMIIQGLFAYASLLILVFFCTAIGKWITNKNKKSGLISILVFVFSLALTIYLEVQADKFPIVKFSLLGMNYSLTSIILEIVIFVSLFTATSFIMERKIEN